MSYTYYFKGTYYFRKVIHKRYIKNRDKNLNYRRSLKLCMDEWFYYFLSKNKNELDKLTDYINFNITNLLGKKLLEINDINLYIEELCENYKKEACIENSDLEKKRIEDLQYIDEDGIHLGYQLQAITVKFKEVDDHYHNLNNESKEKTQQLGTEIIKRTNISMERVLKEVPPEKLIDFYEVLIKNEREVLKNDLRTYVKRNLFQFYPLIEDKNLSEENKVEEALYKYIDLVYRNVKQKNYLDFIKKNSVKPNNAANNFFNSFNNQEELLEELMKKINKTTEKKILDTKLSIEKLIEKYIDFKKPSDTVRKRMALSLRLLRDFLSGDGKEYQPKNIEDLTLEDIKQFEELCVECHPRSENHLRDKTIFELVEYRKSTNGPRYEVNTISQMETDIKDFWKYLSKYIDTNLNNELFDAFYFLSSVKEKNADENISIKEDPLRRFTNEELQRYIDEVYTEKKVKDLLIDNPKNFYSFFFSLMTGVRIGEFTFPRIENLNVQEKDGKRVYYIWLNEDIKPQTLKNQNSHRNLIIPEPLIELGFLNYVEKRVKREKVWLWDFPNCGYSSLSMFHQRNIKKLFPENADTTENRMKGNDIIQYKSLRKNFSEYIFSKNFTSEYGTEQNKKRLIGHSEGSISGRYLGRIEPIQGKSILDELGDYDLNLNNLKEIVNSHYKAIIKDLDFLEDKNNWMNVSKVKPQKRRKT